MKVRIFKKKIVWIPLLIILLGYMYFLYTKYKAYDYVFQIPDTELYIFTKKQWGGRFLIMFADHKDGVRFSPEVDSWEVSTGALVKILLDKNIKNQIAYRCDLSKVSLNQVHYNFIDMADMEKREYINMLTTKDGRFREDCYIISIWPREYRVALSKIVKDEPILIELKKANFWGR